MGINKETKKGFWYLAIMVLTTLLIMGMTYQARIKQKQAGKTPAETQEQVAGQDKSSGGGSAPTGGGSSQTTSPQGGGLQGYSLSPKSGGQLGGSYLLKNLSSTEGPGFENANIFLRSVSGTSGAPKYSATVSGNIIDVVMDDTRNIDFNTGAKTYSGSNPVRVNGRIIKSIAWYTVAESRLGVKITLQKQAPFEVITKTSPITIEVRVEI